MLPSAKRTCLTVIVLLVFGHVPLGGEYYRLGQHRPHHPRQLTADGPQFSSFGGVTWTNSRRRMSSLRRHSEIRDSVGNGSSVAGGNGERFTGNRSGQATNEPVSGTAQRMFNPPLPVTECPSECRLNVADIADVRAAFLDAVDDDGARVVYFRVNLVDHILPVLETYPYMDNSYRATEWVWASERYGRRLLSLPLDADVLSLYTLVKNRKHFVLRIESSPPNCLVALSPECRLHAVRRLLILNVTRSDRHNLRRDFLCHYVINSTAVATRHPPNIIGNARLMYRCCETADFRSGDDVTCRLYIGAARDEMRTVLIVIDILAVVVTLFSPILILRAKMALRFDASTKFFRASLKHGITGQRNYVIRISSRQLINLADRHPFSIPRSAFRLVCHGYGEGRCCIHWWGSWEYQPNVCRHRACCRRCWLGLARTVGVMIAYPFIMYVAVGLYLPRIPAFYDLVRHVRDSDSYGGQGTTISLDVNLVGAALTPPYDLSISVWLLFSFCAFMYGMVVLSSPNNPLERCLLRYDGKRPSEQTGVLYNRMTRSYKAVLQRLAYGEFPTKRHFFRIPWVPWGVRRVVKFVVRILSMIPVVHVCFTTFMFDAKIFDAESVQARQPTNGGKDQDRDEATDKMSWPRPPSARFAGRWCLVTVIWFGFALMLAGYCTAVFLMVEFVLNVVLFVTLAAAMNSSIVIPWAAGVALVAVYINDALSEINAEHRHVLRLIDENSPRISAVEEPEVSAAAGARAPAQTLRTHNLGAVKFIDSDNTEYVSKELYYNVCAELKCGWTGTLRRLVRRTSLIAAYVAFLLAGLTTINSFVVGAEWTLLLVGITGSAAPKLLQMYAAARGLVTDRRAAWSRVIPDILDRHIRVDRTRCIDDAEEPLSTYDVRPIGLVEMELPRVCIYRTLKLWKFPWIVSGDQQIASSDPVLVALANKLAASNFLARAVTRAYPPELLTSRDPTVLRQWCLLVESSILEAATTAGSVNGTPLDSVPLFPRNVLPLVAPVDAGTTVDSVVDTINRELYAPYTRGVLVTIANTSIAVYKLDMQILAFNGSCHGDQVTDLFGAILVAADFNTQNLQAAVKYVLDPYRPDAVPVYSAVPVEAYVFRSPEILEIESVV